MVILTRLKRCVQNYSYESPKKGRFVSLAYLKNAKLISVDTEDSLRERCSQQHKNTTEASEMEQKFNEFSQKLDLVMEQIAALSRTSQQKTKQMG